MFKNKSTRSGFTLIELLVVIAIIAILSVVLILTLNPAELLRQARDSNRVSDLATLKSAISLYLADVSSPSIIGSNTHCMTSGPTSPTGCNNTVIATRGGRWPGRHAVGGRGDNRRGRHGPKKKKKKNTFIKKN